MIFALIGTGRHSCHKHGSGAKNGGEKKIPLRNPEIPPLRDSEIRRLFSAVAAGKYAIIPMMQPISGFRSAI
ncbi:hypothetical protein [Rhizobium sp. L43]|uniref:hypothetical protein n=1 Tax=Rhizobium sp. L43 TaxID=2035452 RepID=UPI001179D50C|nr:hypothetical protein [Rhizobium sp. L43]